MRFKNIHVLDTLKISMQNITQICSTIEITPPHLNEELECTNC